MAKSSVQIKFEYSFCGYSFIITAAGNLLNLLSVYWNIKKVYRVLFKKRAHER